MKNFIKKNKKMLFLVSALVIFLGGSAIFQVVVNQLKPFEEVPVVNVEKRKEKKVEEHKEVLCKPVANQIQIAREYYDSHLKEERLEKALIYFEGVYRPHYGLDYQNNGEAFDVMAATSGTVIKKENDALLGWTLSILNDSGITTTYQSVDSIKVEKGDKIKQGQVIARSGENVYESDLKSHLHFVLSKDNKVLNPQQFFNHEITKIKA
ncbi:M23 family metallopeptidase [Erysipelatoclostridium sp. AM42-17]|uniref:M23 family metallopeptidase n=1 Tax=Erysipelatoclostridium sp. AM42-17 TaxID=2293102 RepID=UPI000E503558|nr:M23 family metallopeptidase [Erysipelatoclostridium sp. AM42-17]RHS91132.1 M23 family peptidase [Erysipelatoclostridium sp. AM42-17]